MGHRADSRDRRHGLPALVDLEDADMNEQATPTSAPYSPGPHGLGGWLWLFGVPLMLWGTVMLSLLPLVMWELTPAQWASSKASFMKAGWSMAEYRQFLAEEFLQAAIWLFGIFVAEAFFRRSPHFRWAATLWLISASLLAFLSGLRQPLTSLADLDPDTLQRLTLFTLPLLLPIPCLWLSRRVRNTFSSQPPMLHRPGFLNALLDGPRDWGGGVWCVAGATIVLAYLHASLVMAHRPYIVPPELTPRIAALLNAPAAAAIEGHGNAASALITMSYTAEVAQVPYARMFLAIHAAGLLLALWSFRLFIQRASRLRWTISASAVVLVAAHALYWWMQERIPVFCVYCGHYDAPRDHLAKSLSLLIMVVALLLLPAVRRRFRSTSGNLRLS
jgi:hypothetical protein